VAALFITAFILSTLLSPDYSQGNMSQTIKELPMSPKINVPDKILKNFKEGKSKTRIIVNIRDPLVGPRQNLKNMNVRRQLENDVVGAQDIVINSMDVGNVSVTNRFLYIFGFSAEVTPQGLQDLVNNHNVLSVDDDMILHNAVNRMIYRAVIDSNGRGILREGNVNVYQCEDICEKYTYFNLG
jgi:hypothetical protein